jgi:hypothetical protein
MSESALMLILIAALAASVSVLALLVIRLNQELEQLKQQLGGDK